MSSLRRQLASRANGARSRGPVTPQGKQRSAENAIRHGILAKCLVIKGESHDAFQEIMDAFVARWAPADEIEMGLVEEMASASWRLRRCWAIETRAFDNAMTDSRSTDPIGRMADSFASLAAGPQLGLLHRYETRLHMMYQRALDNLVFLQSGRMPNDPNPDPEHDQDPVHPPDAAPAPTPEPAPAPVPQPPPAGPDPAPQPDPTAPAAPQAPNEEDVPIP